MGELDVGQAIAPYRRVALSVMLTALLSTLAAVAASAFTVAPGFTATTYTSLPLRQAGPLAFLGTTLYVADPASGTLYAAPNGGPATLWTSAVGPLRGITAGPGGFLYAVRGGAALDVVRIDPATGTVLGIVATNGALGGCPNAIAADNIRGELFVTSCNYIWRIADVLGAPATQYYSQIPLGSGYETYGIVVAPDHSLYVTAPILGTLPGQVWRINGPSDVRAVADVAEPRGIAVISGFMLVNGTNGVVSKIPIPGAGSGSTLTVLAGGARGDLATLGPDGCFYASQGTAVIRVADASGACDLVQAAPPPPPPTLTLTRTSAGAPLVGGGDQSFSASFSDLPNPGGITVTFSVSGANVLVASTATAPNGVAGFAYSATSIGTDTVVATAVVSGRTYTSNTVNLTWPRAFDTVKPVITYVVSAVSRGENFACPHPALGEPGVAEYCGWYTSPPTITWTATAAGASGLDRSRTVCPPFTLNVNSPILGTPVTCLAYNGDGVSSALKVVLQALITAPTITGSAGSYLAGTPTNEDVTVTFTCATDLVLGSAGISFCSAPTTVQAEGTTVVDGYVLDVAGTRRMASFGPVVIDRTPPMIAVASMTTAADGLPYSGAPTRQDVVVTFSCTDNLDPAPRCPAPITATSSSPIIVTASDRAGNTGTYRLAGIAIDRTGPEVSATIVPPPDATGVNAFSARMDIVANDASGVASIFYSATGAQTIPPTLVRGASAQVALDVVGTTTVTYHAVDTLGNIGPASSTRVTIVARQATSLSITSAPFAASGGVVIAAILVGQDGVSPVAGRSVQFTSGGTTSTGVTGADGRVLATLSLEPGVHAVTAIFAGDTAYYGSTAAVQALTVYRHSQFVIWGGDGIHTGQRVQFWGARWAQQAADSPKARASFKGFANAISSSGWSAQPGRGNAPEHVASYISVIVTTEVAKRGDVISGNITQVVVLRVESPETFRNLPGAAAFGTVVGTVP